MVVAKAVKQKREGHVYELRQMMEEEGGGGTGHHPPHLPDPSMMGW